MKKINPFMVGALLALATMSVAYSMSQSSVPSKFGIPWGNSAGPTYIRAIPQASQIGIVNCAASLTDGFPPLTFTPAGSGGCPPFGQDMNGILKQITQWNQWQSAGGPVFWDSAFSTSIGGYPKGSILQSTVLPGRLYLSVVDNNTTNPDATNGTAANWAVLPGTNQPGTMIAYPSTTAPIGMVLANGLTVGNASSNATGRANADTFLLFNFLWSSCATCTLFNSAGGVISRGANPAADFTANDAIATINANGAALMGADSQGTSTSNNLAGVPVQSGTRFAPSSIVGENLHQLSVGELASHLHSITLNDPGHVHGGVLVNIGAQANSPPGGLTGSVGNTASATTGITLSSVNGANNTTSAGSNTPHNTVDRSVITYWYHAL